MDYVMARIIKLSNKYGEFKSVKEAVRSLLLSGNAVNELHVRNVLEEFDDFISETIKKLNDTDATKLNYYAEFFKKKLSLILDPQIGKRKSFHIAIMYDLLRIAKLIIPNYTEDFIESGLERQHELYPLYNELSPEDERRLYTQKKIFFFKDVDINDVPDDDIMLLAKGNETIEDVKSRLEKERTMINIRDGIINGTVKIEDLPTEQLGFFEEYLKKYPDENPEKIKATKLKDDFLKEESKLLEDDYVKPTSEKVSQLLQELINEVLNRNSEEGLAVSDKIKVLSNNLNAHIDDLINDYYQSLHNTQTAKKTITLFLSELKSLLAKFIDTTDNSEANKLADLLKIKFDQIIDLIKVGNNTVLNFIKNSSKNRMIFFKFILNQAR